MVVMNRSRKTALVVAAGLLAGAPAAYAAITEVGAFDPSVVPACPAKPCKAFSRTTGFQVKVGDERDVDVVKADGRIVAWTIKLAKPGPKQIAFFNENLGGEPTAQITVLRAGNKQYHRVLAQGDPQKLTPYLGSTVQFALKESIPVKKGYVIGLTVPTWAPALSVDRPGTTSWRASRAKGTCDDVSSQTAQTRTDNVVRFYCLYRTAQLTYSATIVPDPKPTPTSR